ncbi:MULTISPECIES: ribulose-phosphate 3-epimerase [Xanthomarina]|uniref:Ribulose-phosphate 3-epimerase n=1 Tax=Xanthomarina gelatinilytica TaxID=1137281 RepID=M7MKI5_9FLAO|nr:MULTISPECIES: ribulose-phosphate 3-epimerase [Xanthomarina]EMQ95601.1 Ribulose-phosphate 3-epimerase [Xanthomarina gelatinilytica]MAL23145.1 ribulose-phosphate 3-epimerase [Xanthomarina sp.]MBF60590.1 ribulose-phosphate 3-epimerase [Xanthomarina sp.]HAI19069.1 ribulose-phosphate 3-epimerase [Xanthomarina gelatinilytica]|tara:strand:+ start:720 stop:1382 length:663 start_codon:yes stop_codon:yes gene_type:complete
MNSKLIAPSMLAADFGNLQRDVEMVNNSDADWFHIDVMDGHFVPNISYGMPVIQAMKKHATKPFDVHLMIEKPERYIEDFAKVGADIITVHYESTVHLHRTLTQIEDAGCKAGVVLNLTTPVSVLEDILPKCFMVLLMSINPGFGGQKFEDITYNRIKKLRRMIDEQGLSTKIEIDGGVTDKNIKQLVEAGADVFVAGSHVFKSENPTETIKQLKQIANS